MDTEVENSRPNIRIQIANDVSQASEEKMDVDDSNDNEEGEISDDNVNYKTGENADPSSNNKVISGINAVFTTGINIFDKKEQEKLHERAKRFALKPDEIHSFNDQDLQDLHESLGINLTNESEFKFETIHLLGLSDMTAEDVVDYFANYAPEGIEWIDHNSCNVVWLDNISAARALHFKSSVVRGMPAREPKDIFPKEFLDDVKEPDTAEEGQSVLIKNKNREIELQNEIGEVILPKKKTYPKNSVDIAEITIPIPPGYWRLGNTHPKTKCLLVRFGKVTDKLPFKSEKCNKYYKKLSNPTHRSVISETKKKELRTIFERNKELNQKKNPWGSLAKNWDKDAKFREREPIIHFSNDDDDDDDVQIIEVKNPKLSARLGTKRKLQLEEDKPEEKKDENDMNSRLTERKTTKVPRMKMYADEEEENQKRRKILMKIKKQVEKLDKQDDEGDLRSMLCHNNRLLGKKDLTKSQPALDLGTRLRNRSQRLVFAVERDAFHQDYYDDYDTRPLRLDERRELIEKRGSLRHRERSPLMSRSVLLRTRLKEERLSPEKKRHSDRHRSHSHRSSRKRSLERTLHSDRMHHSSKSSHSQRGQRSHSPNSRHGEKPRSKVAVVIKKPSKPAVASTIWSRVQKSSESEQSTSESESESEESDRSSSSGSSQGSSSSNSSSESESESESGAQSETSTESAKRIAARNPDRPGFDMSRLSKKVDHKSPLKITTTNEHFKQKKSKRA